MNESLNNLFPIWFYCTAIVGILGVIDFFVGKEANKWLKDNILFKPWYNLSLFTFINFIKRAALLFSKVINRLFGSKLFSGRAYVASIIITYVLVSGTAVALSYSKYYYLIPLKKEPWLKEGGDYINAHFIALMLINPFFNIVSFAITRFFAKKISTSNKLFWAFILWILDVVFCIIISFTAMATIEYIIAVVAPNNEISNWFNGLYMRNVSIFAFFSGFIPTLIHIIFFLGFLILLILEFFRQGIRFVLEKLDSKGERPMATIAAVLTIILIFLNLFITYFEKYSS